MPNIYAQGTKITNVTGRSKYITDAQEVESRNSEGLVDYITGKTGRQEEVVLDVRHMSYSWEFHALFEQIYQHQEGQEQTEAREIIIALPNELAGAKKGTTTEAQKKELKEIITEISDRLIGPDHDWEAAFHWNHDRTNFHVHLLYSTRPVLKGAHIKRYGHDIWVDKTTHSFAKSHADNAILVHHKGDIQMDAQGKPKYSTAPLGAKDPKFKSKSFNSTRNKVIQSVLEEHGYHLDIQDRSTPYLSQRKLYKYSSDEYKQAASQYNAAVKEYNSKVREHLSIEPDKRADYVKVRHDIEREVKKQNAAEKKISGQAIYAIKLMTEKVKIFIQNAYQKVRANVSEWWTKNKDIVLAAFRNQLDTTTDQKENQHAEQRERNVGSTLQAEQRNTDIADKTERSKRKSAEERITALRNFGNGGDDSKRKQDSEARKSKAPSRTYRIKH